MIEHVTQDYLKHVYVVNPSGGGGASSVNLVGTNAGRPAAGTAGRIYYTTDAPVLYRDNGVTWNSFGPIYNFTDPNLQTWHDYNMSGTTVTVSNGHRVARFLSNATDIKGQYVNVTAPYTAIMAMTSFWVGGNAGAAAFFTDGTKAEFVYFQNATITLLRFTNPSTFSSTVFSQQYFFPQGLWWFKLEDDGANRKVSFSSNGEDWIQFSSFPNNTFLTATGVGYLGVPNTAGGLDLIADILSMKIT